MVNGGANPNDSDYDGRTPLMVAAQCGKIDVVKLLIEKHNASLNQIDKFKLTALDSADLGKHFEIVDFKSKGAMTSKQVFDNLKKKSSANA